MILSFTLDANGSSTPITTDIHTLIIAGWSGRDTAAIEHHIKELAELGIKPPSALPLYYRVSPHQLTQDSQIQVVGDSTSGEVEAFIFPIDGELYVTVASDHTDRKLEAYSIALSKQICSKPIGGAAWRMADVQDHWDDLVLRSYIEEGGHQVLYQEGSLASLRSPGNLIAGLTAGATTLPDHTAMSCGTVGAIGGIRPSASFSMELFDPRLNRCLSHHYRIQCLPEIA
ncbi:MAG: DUF2848 domain-containing protein [Castellaniella sp.]|uniref:DUF2848 domain-containing protein n=1 Tax=Castellaniella sp. TaxID=1955812 RepID=UPI001209F114|nr:DUF2848 domain-containing protein [Castellaniella sp.]TAN30041.1 MAG: DUF2848 domain-containing protein [Castellaniella sp.]